MGAFIGSWLLKQVGFYSFILIVSCISIFISFSYWFLHANEPFLSSNSKKEITPSENHIKQSFWPQILVIAITGLHVGAFNTLLPIYFQLFREWDATFFGAASGIAGIGALSASLFKHLKYQYVVAILLLGMGDILIIYLNEPRAAVFFGFFIGFSINTLRIHARAMILNAPINEEMTIKTISISNYFFFCLNGITPLCITLLLTFYESTAQQYGMTLALIGVVCSIVLLVNEYIRMRQESTLKLRGTKL